MMNKGFIVTPSDASPELAREAEARLGCPERSLAFQDLEDEALYDGVWANACLLHAPRLVLANDLARIFRALKSESWLAASFKAGKDEGRWGRSTTIFQRRN